MLFLIEPFVCFIFKAVDPRFRFPAVMRYFLPQQCSPLPVSPSNHCSPTSSVTQPMYHELLPPCDCQQNFCQTSKGSTSGFETLSPSTVSNQDDTLANSENSVLDAGEYIHVTEPWKNCRAPQSTVRFRESGSCPLYIFQNKDTTSIEREQIDSYIVKLFQPYVQTLKPQKCIIKGPVCRI